MDLYLYKSRIHNIMQKACMKLFTPANDFASAGGFRVLLEPLATCTPV